MTLLNMANHTPPWTHFLNIELIIQIISIKAQQSMTGFLFLKLPRQACQNNSAHHFQEVEYALNI